MVVEDVHWADSSTLDCLTFLGRAGGLGAVTLVVTCRSDEAPLDRQVAGWLAHVRGGRGVEEIRLAPLSKAESADLVEGLATLRYVSSGAFYCPASTFKATLTGTQA